MNSKRTSEDKKYCGRCKTWVFKENFAKHKGTRDGLQHRCTMCRSIHHQNTKHNRVRKVRTYEERREALINSYGITVEQFNKMLNEQNFCCGICFSSNWGKESPLIDHDHKTGEVRGLLCNSCNRALGMFKDSSKVLLSAYKYLRRFEK